MTFIVTEPASDRTLLSVAERRAAVGVEDSNKDADLAVIEARVAATIAAACRVPSAGANSPTLRAETICVTYRLVAPRRVLILPRRPVVSIISVVEYGVTLAAAEYETEAAAGLLNRLSGDDRTCWTAAKIVVTATAGWVVVPADLKLAAAKFMAAEWTQGSRDPLLRRIKVEGISEREYWVDPTRESVIPAEVMDILERGGYVEPWV